MSTLSGVSAASPGAAAGDPIVPSAAPAPSATTVPTAVESRSRALLRTVLVFLVLAVVTGLVYPLAFTGFAQVVFPRQANGSLVEANGQVVGSELIGQMFTSPRYFHGRPSASDYDSTASGGSNLGPSSAELAKQVRERVAQVRTENNLQAGTLVPADLVTASFSALDPHISPEAAELQVPRVARVRGISEDKVRELVHQQTSKPVVGIWGTDRVNVLLLNRALDAIPTVVGK